MPSPFHEPLKKATTIRLLRIICVEACTIRICLTVADLEDELDYDCLSYVWGQPIFDVEIQNQHGLLPITPTLASALRRLCILNHRRSLWVDGICIDQTNHDERVQQVQLMRQIFGQAKTVIADLGEASKYSDLAVDLCQTIGNRTKQPEPASALFGNVASSFPDDLPPIQEDCWIGFRQLIARSWFTRVWIIQEYLVAENVSMLCGHKQFDASVVFDAMRYIYDHQLLGYDKRVYTEMNHVQDFTAASRAASYLTLLRNQKMMLARGHELHLSTFLQRGILFGATDARDRLYAIVNLVKLELSSDTTPDYSVVSRVVHQRLFRHLARTGVSMLIELLHAIGLPRSDLSAPTWLPDWTTKCASQSLEAFRRRRFGEMPKPIFRAGIARSKQYHLYPEVILSDDLSTLSVKSIIVDTLEYTCGNLFQELDDNISDNTMRASILSAWLSDVLLLAAIVRADEDVVWRTLIANVNITDRENSQQMSSVPPASFAINFTRFKSYVLNLDGDPEDSEDTSTAIAASFLTMMGYVMRGRVFGTTRSGKLCLVPENAQKDDKIVIIIGATAPFVVRSSSMSSSYEILGHGYVHGLMQGEVFCNNDFHTTMLDFV